VGVTTETRAQLARQQTAKVTTYVTTQIGQSRTRDVAKQSKLCKCYLTDNQESATQASSQGMARPYTKHEPVAQAKNSVIAHSNRPCHLHRATPISCSTDDTKTAERVPSEWVAASSLSWFRSCMKGLPSLPYVSTDRGTKWKSECWVYECHLEVSARTAAAPQ
jgi:hypothetical protein